MGKKKVIKKKNNIFDKLKGILQSNAPHKGEKKTDCEYGAIIVENLESAEHIGAEDEVFESLNGVEKNQHYRFIANQKYFNISVYALGTIAVAALIIYFIINLSSVVQVISNFLSAISIFIAGFFIAFMLNPLVKWVDGTILIKLCKIESAKKRSILSILITYLITLGLLILGFSYIIPQLAASVSDLLKRQENLYKEAVDFLGNIEEKIPQIDFKFIEERLESLWPELVNYASGLVKDVFPKLLNLGISLFKIAINALLSVAVSIYMLYDKRKLTKMMTRIVYAILPVRKASSVTVTLKECSNIFTGFIVGKSIDSLIIGIICFIAMSILNLPYVMLLSVIVGITNMIPYFGPFIGAVPGVFLFLCINPVNAIIFTIMIFILQQFDGWVLGPWILGESTGISPLWVIFAITVGGVYAGVLGMFLGVPVIAVISYLFNRLIDGKLKKKKVIIK